MTPSELKYNVESTGKEQFFFDRKTMKFWGDTMKNYGVRSTIVRSNFDQMGNYHEQGIERVCWELYRKNPVKHGMKKSAYFDKVTFERVRSIQE